MQKCSETILIQDYIGSLFSAVQRNLFVDTVAILLAWVVVVLCKYRVIHVLYSCLIGTMSTYKGTLCLESTSTVLSSTLIGLYVHIKIHVVL